MIVNFALLQELFRAFHIQRWNDRLRPMELIEMDKHAHKMIIAYCLGKYEESKGNTVNWIEIINGGIYELLRRIIISDIKSPIYNEIRKNKEVFAKLNKFIYEELKQKIESKLILGELKEFLFTEKTESSLSTRILEAAHIYASFWEFQIIKQSNPNSYQNVRIETELLNQINSFSDLDGIALLTHRHTIYNFVDLCGQLRFQYRWAQLPRVPKTSVLGHVLMVAVLSYFFARDNGACDKRLYNDFFGGLFHDLPEAVTRDIISPVKESSKDFEKLIKSLESELAEAEIYPLIEPEWVPEIKYFTHEEFNNKIIKDGNLINNGLSITKVNDKYNNAKFNPYDGEIIRAADHLSAFLEVWNSCISGITTEELSQAVQKIKSMYKDKEIGKVELKMIYSSFYTL
jgi:putative hydrolase of HD superfamily